MKTIVLSVVGAILIGGFFCFALLLAVLVTIGDDAEKQNAGKTIVAVRHEFFWSETEETVFKKQCVEHTVGVCSSPVGVNPNSKRADSDTNCETHRSAPQPFADKLKTSETYEYQFELEPEKTYYWFALLRKDFDCHELQPPEMLGFQTGEIKLANGETKRIEADFTK